MRTRRPKSAAKLQGLLQPKQDLVDQHPLYENQEVELTNNKGQNVGSASGWAEFTQTSKEAEVLLEYSTGALAGRSALAKIKLPKATTWILSCRLDRNLMSQIITDVLAECDLVSRIQTKSEYIEVAVRENETNEFLFAMNHSNEDGSLVLEKDSFDLISSSKISAGSSVAIPAGGWLVLQSSR